MDLASVNKVRKENWGKNALYYTLGKVNKGIRKKNIWIFSCWNGMRYSDNAKYLFEYVSLNCPQIDCYWQTKNLEVFHTLQEKGINVQLIGTREAIRTQKKAGVAVYTNGVDDFGDVPYIYGAKLVCLWHGISLKKTYRLQLAKDRNIVRTIFGDIKWNVFNYMKQDITISTSDYISDWFYRGFRLKNKSGICVCGQARNDGFAKTPIIPNRISDLCKNKRIILYMPTFRVDNSIILREVKYIFQSVEIKNILEEYNCVLICKLHFLCQASIADSECCFLLNDESVSDVQRLQLAADMLISDYSGSGIDYALLRRPIMFYFPDWNEYNADEVMMPETKEICSINCAWNRDDFILTLKEMLINPNRGLRQTEKINHFFNTTDIKIGEYSQKNFEGICKLLGEESK